jgi:hypothetical protein
MPMAQVGIRRAGGQSFCDPSKISVRIPWVVEGASDPRPYVAETTRVRLEKQYVVVEMRADLFVDPVILRFRKQVSQHEGREDPRSKEIARSATISRYHTDPASASRTLPSILRGASWFFAPSVMNSCLRTM